MSINYNTASFTVSAAAINNLPIDSIAEIAFIGRSNSGKSSALNAITNIKGLARTSKTPGRTQLINYFQITSQKYLVDLPGYGFAKVPKALKLNWEKLVGKYLETRKCLQGLVLLMDIRHPLKDLDKQMLAWAVKASIPVHILLTKADKLKRNAANNALFSVQKALSSYGDLISIQLFSAVKPLIGVNEVKKKLDFWLKQETLKPE